MTWHLMTAGYNLLNIAFNNKTVADHRTRNTHSGHLFMAFNNKTVADRRAALAGDKQSATVNRLIFRRLTRQIKTP